LSEEDQFEVPEGQGYFKCKDCGFRTTDIDRATEHLGPGHDIEEVND
jgi:tRNA(Ile2) C34 agmatinyltransferase TiaS